MYSASLIYFSRFALELAAEKQSGSLALIMVRDKWLPEWLVNMTKTLMIYE